MHCGVSLAEIAGLTDVQIKELYFRPRDKFGALLRRGRQLREGVESPKTKAWQKQSFGDMFKTVWRNRGKTEEEAEERWRMYLGDNPTLRLRIERNEQVRNKLRR